MLIRLSTLVKGHPVATFFVLTYALSWSLVPFGGPFLPAGPLVGAVVVIAVTQGTSGLWALGSKMIRWRVGWRWYVAALGLPLTTTLAAVGLTMGLGAPWSLVSLRAWSSMIVVFAVRLIDPLDGPLGEEPGWRGVAVPGLQIGRSPFIATLILGLLVAVWHLPLVVAAGPEKLPPFALLGTIAVTFFYTWMFNHTGGSVFMTLVMHAAEGTFFRFVSGGFTAADATVAFSVYIVVLCLSGARPDPPRLERLANVSANGPLHAIGCGPRRGARAESPRPSMNPRAFRERRRLLTPFVGLSLCLGSRQRRSTPC